MKKIFSLVLVFIIIVAGGVYWYYSIHKKSIIKEKIQQTILKKTDSLYRLTYDSSSVDEMNGDASFYKIKLKVDSSILEKFQKENKAPDIIVDLEIETVSIKGLGSVGLLSEERIDAKTIQIDLPVLKLFRNSKTGNDQAKDETGIDTTEIYARLLGKYNLIKADSIHIRNGSISWNDKVQQKKITLEKYDVHIHHFLIDSMHRYINLAGYFLKDATLKASGFGIADLSSNKKLGIAHIEFDANAGRISIRDINLDNNQHIREIQIAGVNSYEFIYKNVIKCRSLKLHDLDLSLRRVKKAGKPADSLAIHIPNLINSIEVDTLAVSDARLLLTQNNKTVADLKGIDARLVKTKIDSNGISLREVLKDGLFRFSVAHAGIYPIADLHQIELTHVSYINSVQSLLIESFRLAPNTNTNRNNLIRVQSNGIQIEKFNPEKFIFGKIIQCRSVKVSHPDLELRRLKPKTASNGTPDKLTTDVFSLLNVDTLILSNGHFAMLDNSKKTIDLREINTHLYKAKIDGKNISLENLVNESNFGLVVGNAEITPPKGFHHLSIQNIRYLNTTRSLAVGSFSVNPTLRSNSPSVTGKTQQDFFTIICKNILAENFNLGQFIFHDFISAATLNLSIDLRVFTDKFYGDNTESRIGQYPHQLLQKLKIKVDIPKVNFQNSYVQYTEKKAVSGKTGTLFFSQLRGFLSNFSNSGTGSMKLVGDGMLMNSGRAHSEWEFPMVSNKGEFTLKGSIENFDLLLLNEVATNLADAEILSGHLDHLGYKINGHNTASSGEVSFTYYDLKLKILKADENIKIKNTKVLSFLANLVVKNKNTDATAKAFTNDRDPTKSFFNLMWKSIFAGIKKSVSVKK